MVFVRRVSKALLKSGLAAIVSSLAFGQAPPPPSPPSQDQPHLVVQLGHADPVTSVAFSPDGRLVLTGSEDRTAKLWDIETGEELRTFAGHTKEITSVAFSPDGREVLTARTGSEC
jgi:WD40 repeat protein